ncbi:MAG: glycoside hydrolase family 2 TIM barrel-domain containing protein [Planctomycetota bacterium]
MNVAQIECRSLRGILAICAAIVSGSAAAADGHADETGAGLPIANAAAREALSLNGDWQVIVDPVDNGSIDYLSRPRANGYWEDHQPVDESDGVEYAFDASETLAVPGDWNSQRERLFFYEGLVWYRRAFEKPAEGERFFLHFGAVNRRATVWLNGEELGTHEVGFTPFVFEVTGSLVGGENVVIVRVDNRRLDDDVPGLLTDWWNYGGITREVRLLSTPGVFVRDWSVGLSPGGGSVEGWAKVDGAGAGSAVRVSVGASEAVVMTDGEGLASFSMASEGLDRWSPGSPVLHDVRLSIEGDRAHDRVGLRTIETGGGDILLNGERVFLRGVSIHEEAPGGGRAWSEDHARELLGWARDLGCNYVRLAHYPHNEHMLRMADEMGLMVWAEVPVYWVMDYTSERTLGLARTHLREMIDRDRNRASVIIWSVGNETGDDPDRTAFRMALGQSVKAWDPSRLLSAACFMRLERGEDGRFVTMHVDDPFGAMADVLAVNQYVGWYHDTPEDLRGVRVELGWDKPFLVSEFGAGIKQGYHATPTTRWSEQFGERIYRETLDWLGTVDSLDGLSPWILKDFRSPRRPLYGVQDWYNRKGLISDDGERKVVFEVLRERYEAWEASPPGE